MLLITPQKEKCLKLETFAENINRSVDKWGYMNIKVTDVTVRLSWKLYINVFLKWNALITCNIQDIIQSFVDYTLRMPNDSPPVHR